MSGAAPPLEARPALRAPRAAPFVHSGQSQRQIIAAWSLAAVVVAGAGLVLFGPAAARVLSVALLSAVACELLMTVRFRQSREEGLRQALLSGLLVGLTLPPAVAWYVPLVASAIAIIPATWLFGGRGHFLWHPAVVGRVIVQFMFAQQLAVGAGAPPAPILARDRLLLGDIANAEPVPLGHYQGWRHTALGPGADAILVERPATTLRRLAAGALPRADDAPLTAALRDCLPPWRDTVLGTVPGGIGESCTIALVVAALYLVYRGHLRWQLPLAGMLAAGLCAATLPIRLGAGAADEPRWLPALIVENGESVGWLYVLYHLTSGQLLLGLVLLASDMPTCPMTSRGQALFGAGVGALTIAMRQFGVAEGECYWALLALNTVVPPLDRWTRRRPLAILS